MVHLRVNEREPNPNPHINFIKPLPCKPESQENAKQLLRALAAQVKPIMKTHGFTVNSFEEYEYNTVFAGRNWNNGEVIELVLHRGNGTVVPASYLISVLCHELAHIKHMNHGPAFQALWALLRKEVRDLQNKGYYGDGYWSSGRRLVDSAPINATGVKPGDLPEYICGGAQSRTRPSLFRPRRQMARSKSGPSNHTGAQSTKKRKAGTRVRDTNVFIGQGKALNGDVEEGKKAMGAGFGKQAARRAREERALAAERRILALPVQSTTQPPTDKDSPAAESGTDEEESGLGVTETDEDRRRAMDPEEQKTSWDYFADDFQVPRDSCDLPPASGSSTSVMGGLRTNVQPADSKGKGRADDIDDIDDPPPNKRPRRSSTSAPKPSPATQSAELGLGNMVKAEIKLRKNESVGLIAGGTKLGKGPSGSRNLVGQNIKKK